MHCPPKLGLQKEISQHLTSLPPKLPAILMEASHTHVHSPTLSSSETIMAALLSSIPAVQFPSLTRAIAADARRQRGRLAFLLLSPPHFARALARLRSMLLPAKAALLGRVLLRSLLLLLPALSPDGSHNLLHLPTPDLDAALLLVAMCDSYSPAASSTSPVDWHKLLADDVVRNALSISGLGGTSTRTASPRFSAPNNLMAPKKLITKGTPSAAVDADADLGITATSPPPSHVPRSLALKTTPMAPRSAKVDADAVLVTTAASPPPSHVPRSSAPKTASIAPSSAEVEADAVVGVTAASHLGPLLLHSAVPTTAADLRSVSVDAVKYDHGAEAIDPERGRIRGNENDTTGAGAAAANDRDRLKVGTEFVEKYYKSLVSSPHSLHTFYNLQCQVSWTIHGKSFNMKSPTDVQNMMADKTSRGHFSFQGHELHLSKHTIHVVAWGVNILDSTSSNFVQSFMLRPRNRSCSILSDVMFVMMNVPQGSLEIKAGSTSAVKAAPNVRPQKIKIIPYLPRHAAKIAPNDSKVAAIEGAQHSEVLLIYNKACQLHAPAADVVHVENPSRMIQIIDSLKADGVLNRVVSQESDPADRKYVQAVHGEKYMEELIDKLPLSAEQLEACPYISKRKNEMYSSDGTKEAVFLAAGAVIKACDSVAKGHFKKSFALVRPPGHHASTDFSEGFCYVNNAAVGVKYLQNQLGLKRVMVVDIDVHHGNGSQSIFFEDDSVLFFSTHCNLLPYPDNKAAMNYTHIGHGKGKGFNVNVPLEIGFGDADILYVLDHALAPLVKMFQPQKILVSAGFDAAQDDPLGRCKVRPSCFGTVTKKLVELGDGNLIMCLEGGYGETLGECVSNSVRSLLGDKDSGLTAEELRSLPAPKLETIETVQKLNKRLMKSQKDKKCGAGDK